MELKLKRIARKEKYTIGRLMMRDKQNGEWVFLCDTIEDRDRGLDQSMTEANIARIEAGTCATSIDVLSRIAEALGKRIELV